MFNKDFYPIPKNVLDLMLFNFDLDNKIILEPSSGKGDIIDYLKQYNVKDIICCELNPELATISSSKANLIENDFLKVTSEKISHIDMIIANPPFSSDETHILHMWEIAPEGCEIISLCNWETINNSWSKRRADLVSLINEHGYSKNLGDVFSDSERKTGVNIGMVYLLKPKSNKDNEFDGYFDLSEEYEQQENGIIKHNEIKEIVNRYVGAVKMFDSVETISKEINNLIKPINYNENICFGAFKKAKRYGNLNSIDRITFKKELQKQAWNTVFNKFDMSKYVTQSVMNDINKFVELQVNVPFTLRNIYKMIEMIIGTHEGRMKKVIVEAFERICSFSWKLNSEAGEGWKTNSNYKINQNFIHPYLVEIGYNGEMRADYRRSDQLDDVIKALCYMAGKKYENQPSFYYFLAEKDSKYEWGKWYKWNDFFEIKGYKKGTVHFRFIDLEVWKKFNIEYSKIKGWAIPTFTDMKTTGKEKSKKKGVIIYE